MTESERSQHNVPPDPSGIDEPHDILAAEEFTIGTRENRFPGDPTGIREPHDVLAAEEFAMPAGVEPHDDAGGGPGLRAHSATGPRRARAADRAPPPALMPELSPQNRIEITVDRALCIGSGDCVDTAPNVFQLDEEDKAVVVDPDGASVGEVVEAAGNCPVSAIFVVGEEGDLYP